MSIYIRHKIKSILGITAFRRTFEKIKFGAVCFLQKCFADITDVVTFPLVPWVRSGI